MADELQKSTEKFKEYSTTACAIILEEEDAAVEEILKEAERRGIAEATLAPVKDGKPRMLLITAWIAHEGRNQNGLAFVNEELHKRVVEGLFTPPNGGMIDYNHNYMPIGFWYKTSYAYHESAKKWGIIANGAVWAWRFEEETNKILAAMQRDNKVDVSMAAMGESSEFTMDYPGAEGEFTEILHNPIFFTTSILDIKPADADATGTASEDASVEPPNTAGVMNVAAISQQDNKEETVMDKDLEVLQAKLDEALAEIAGLKEKLSAETAKVAEMSSNIAELQTKNSELEVALASASEAKTAVETELVTVKDKLAVYEAQETEKARKVRLDARLAELPEVVRKNLDSHPDKEKLFSSWADASDDEWERTKTVFALAAKDVDYTTRSDREGPLPSASGMGSHLSSIDKFLR